MSKQPKVTLVRFTPNPIATVKLAWDAAKTGEKLETLLWQNPCEVKKQFPQDVEAARELFKKVIAMEIPVSEFVTFVFTFEDVPIWFREQLIRNNRRGQFWSQSHRIYDMSKLYEDKLYHISKSIEENPLALAKYEACMQFIANTYKDLAGLGIPLEDARSVVPVSATHRISMVINLRDLLFMIYERGCHILQGSMWKPLIDQMINELVTKVDPVFKMLKKPVCFTEGKFTYCRYAHDNDRRYEGKDSLPPCCIWIKHVKAPNTPGGIYDVLKGLPDEQSFVKAQDVMKQYYGDFILE